MEFELRCYGATLEVRDEQGGTGIIHGHAAVFNNLSHDLAGFREQILPGAFKRTIETGDARALWQHNDAFVLGRVSARTLKLEEDERGLSFEIIPPPTTWARDHLITMRRRDVNEMSFRFIAKDERWEERSDGVVRSLIDVELLEISPVTFAAYPQTAVAVRSLNAWREKRGDVKSNHDSRAPASCRCSEVLSAVNRLEERLRLMQVAL